MLKKSNLEVLAFPDFFPDQGGRPSRWTATHRWHSDGGTKSEIHEAIAPGALAALFKK